MMQDVLTVIWKEWREFFQQRGKRGSMVSWLLMIGVGGVMMPLQSGAEWLKSPLMPVLWSWLALMSTTAPITDSFAGERERHTLETLLASRLSDRTILYGKIASGMLYGLSLELGILIAAAVTVNVAHWTGQVQFYGLDMLGVLALVLALLLLVASAGVLVSLHSATVRSAYQKITFVFLGVFLIPSFLLPLLPTSFQQPLIRLLTTLPVLSMLLLAAGVVLVIGIAVLLAAQARFQRARLILD